MRFLAVIIALLAGVATAQTPSEAAQAAAVRLQEAQSTLESADGRSDRVAALTQTVQAYEDGLAALRDGLRRAAIRQRTLETDLAARSDEVARLLGVLQTMGRAPAPILLLHPSGPTGTARSGMMLAEVTPALQQKVIELRSQLSELSDLRSLQTDALGVLENGLDGVQTARTELTAAIADRTDLPRRFSDDPVQTALLLASSETLSAFATGLSDTQTNAGPDAATIKGAIPLPVAGQVIRQYNEADAAGVARPGILIATRPRALVTTPVSATVRYSGPLLDYGNVVILEPAAETLWVIAGLAEAFGEAGEILPDGTPIGLMGGEVTQAQAILNESAQGSAGQRTETLYLEVRDRQSAVNPAEWFAFQ
ncbi:peptidoglycan DD-metalloendopeptidase family protein [Octadecabacter sp. 1_MG-2023]|uniref:murein hydrolase activator EnvC family protein n=1 Tax=unclassified Octadecabacter TaxID=196158 RepID=UPI001C09A78C|nr:peptidoglycan DD-metalloendopeptidase family protein [Octadecabacter sp. 1_MG-2023]MBU2992466.1 peptidoglycan DD-metalloendopeptidase family protein [Octadecabacter sp. B2R22]MDO6734778.1 peptidoglycan DD-metalloendopeptidase family protein [Octadecabacter sp. 1_MG-2023]